MISVSETLEMERERAAFCDRQKRDVIEEHRDIWLQMSKATNGRSGVKLKQTKPVQVEAKVLKIHCKVCDRLGATLVDAEGQTIADQEDGYVPGFMPGNHYGDYLLLDIDIDTGRILNWPKPEQMAEGLQSWVDSFAEDAEDE